ncbi:MAG TPA: accessory gene regulator B family protein [Candidatus Paceibacterota bacterium]
MEKLARKLASNIAISLDYNKEREQIVAYGLIAIIQTLITVFLGLIIGLFAGVPIEALIICFSVNILRKYSGGAHAGSIELCTSVAVIYIITFSLISRYLLSGVLNSYIMAIIIFIVYALSYLLIYKLAPVDSPKKLIKTDKKKKRMRKGSFTILTICFTVSIILFLLSQKKYISYSLGLSLLFGLSWQVFTLTKPGSSFIHLIDSAVSKIVRI